jgi:hypothetical protein
VKKILRPSEEEDALYYSDFSGQLIDPPFVPPCQITFNFNYGSDFDGEQIVVDLTNDESKQVLLYLKEHLTSETKNNLCAQKSSVGEFLSQKT